MNKTHSLRLIALNAIKQFNPLSGYLVGVNRMFLSNAIVNTLSDNPFRLGWREYWRLKQLPRLTHTSSTILDNQVELTDPYWYLYSYREIFLDQIYRFDARRNQPLIIDCGANIGLSIIFFNYLYPNAEIIAFEPDSAIFTVLEKNVRSFQIRNIELYQKAVWIEEKEIAFLPDGSVGGTIIPNGTGDGLVYVETIRLRDFLQQEVDFLKIDIEGAEYEVIKDNADLLVNVKNVFVEYHGKHGETQTLHKMLQILQRAGFRYHLKEANPVQQPFLVNERRRFYDLQTNIFGFRE